MPDALSTVNLRATPQSAPADPRQVKNNAGGHVFTIDPTARLRRFLILGVDGGTYYTGERELTAETAAFVLDLARTDGTTVTAEALAISTAGRAPKNNPALFALAAVTALGDPAARAAARAALPAIARTGTHLLTYVRYAAALRGWGRHLRGTVASWYTTKDAPDLAYQVAKYASRDGYSHRDVLRLAHPKAPTPAHAATFDYACGRLTEATYNPNEGTSAHAPLILEGALRAAASPTPADTAALVREYRLPWETLRSEHLTDPTVWQALLDVGMGYTALLRNLPRLTRLGVLDPGGDNAATVAARLTNPTEITRARAHPVNILIAQRTYASGHSLRGTSSWTPTTTIVDALDAAFYAAFPTVVPAGKRTLLGLDVSGSMGSPVAGLPLSCREASAALALTTLATEPSVTAVGFTGSRSAFGWGHSGRTELTALDLSPRRRLDDNIRAISNLPFGTTDCSLPMQHALKKGLEVDTFAIYTDSETYAGSIHPHQALAQYRRETGINARLVVLAMTPTSFSIANPTDPGMLDVAGLDSAVPTLLADFSRGDLS